MLGGEGGQQERALCGSPCEFAGWLLVAGLRQQGELTPASCSSEKLLDKHWLRCRPDFALENNPNRPIITECNQC